MPNSLAYFSCWPGVFITPDGKVRRQLRHNRAGFMVNTGRLVNADLRSRDRTCF
jgi:hypothetical protein